MNWSLHLRSLDRMITLLAILAFIAGGAFLSFSTSRAEFGIRLSDRSPSAPCSGAGQDSGRSSEGAAGREHQSGEHQIAPERGDESWPIFGLSPFLRRGNRTQALPELVS